MKEIAIVVIFAVCLVSAGMFVAASLKPKPEAQCPKAPQTLKWGA